MILQKYLDRCFILMPKRNGFKSMPYKKTIELLNITKKK